jgi:Amt family ammonium transporter
MSGGASITGGWMNGNYVQIVYQILAVSVTGAWSFLLTVIILVLINLIPVCKIRISEKGEAV